MKFVDMLKACGKGWNDIFTCNCLYSFTILRTPSLLQTYFNLLLFWIQFVSHFLLLALLD